MRVWIAAAVSAFAGVIALSYELIWYRAFALANQALADSFPRMLGVYLFGLAIGSAIAARLLSARDRIRRPIRWVAATFAVAGAAAYLAVPLYARAVEHTPLSERVPWLALGAALLGAVFPLVAQFAIPPDARSGRRLSYLYVANIAGSTAGSLLTGFWAMDHFTLAALSRGLLLLSAAAAIALLVFDPDRDRRSIAGAAGIAAVSLGLFALAPSLFDRVYERLLVGDAHGPAFRFSEVIETRAGVITVGPDKIVHGGGTYDGAINADPRDPVNQIFRAYAVAGLHPHPREVLMIGLSSGSWANAVASLRGVERITVVEINPGYLQLIRNHPEVRGLLSDPRVQIEIDDARRWLARHPLRRFDAIVANVMVHWIGSSSHVLSSEFIELIHQHLNEGGVYFFNATGSGRAARTALLQFPSGLRLGSMIAVSDAPLHFDAEAWKAAMLRAPRPDGAPFVTTPEDRDAVLRIAHDVEIRMETREHLLGRTTELPLITDDNMGVEWQ
jgi:spermidine synthase